METAQGMLNPALIRSGVYSRQANGQARRLALEAVTALVPRAQAGEAAALKRIVRAGLQLVTHLARQYENLGLPLLDLLYAGHLGLLQAVKQFNPNHGVKFSERSVASVEQAIRRALARQSRTLRLLSRVQGCGQTTEQGKSQPT
jgi:RNA polymerase primary sigma factor